VRKTLLADDGGDVVVFVCMRGDDRDVAVGDLGLYYLDEEVNHASVKERRSVARAPGDSSDESQEE
jgi:hypothetical protein